MWHTGQCGTARSHCRANGGRAYSGGSYAAAGDDPWWNAATGDSDGPVVTVKGLRAPVRGLSFGSVAERYDRYRLGYPGELGTTVLRYARRPVLAALEVGAGTGKASRLFGSLGIEVTALEPDADMRAC